MAFGDFKGSLGAGTTDVTNPFSGTGSEVVAVGDLIVVAVAERSSLTVSAVNDNLGNTYSAQNAGTDGGNTTGRAFYSRVTVAGTVTSVDVTTTASADDCAIAAGVWEGPFVTSPLDANPANASGDTSNPYPGPASGTLSQADELIVAWATIANGRTMTVDAPFSLALSQLSAASGAASSVSMTLAYQLVAATTTQTPSFNQGAVVSASVLGTMSFKKDLTTGQPAAKRMGGIPFTSRFRGKPGIKIW